MPAAAVIPAPTAYINVVAVKKLVVGVMVCSFLEGLVGFTAGRFDCLRHIVSLLLRCALLHCRAYLYSALL